MVISWAGPPSLLENHRTNQDSTIGNNEQIKQAVDNFSSESLDVRHDEEEAVKTLMAKRIVPPYGMLPAQKPEGVTRIMFGNANSINYTTKSNFKVAQLQGFYRKYDINIAGIVEIGINWSTFKVSQNLTSLFQMETNTVKSSAGHNKHESAGRSQYGGTGILAMDEICDKIKATGKDARGLGRWSWLKLTGEQGFTTRVITAYQPCLSKNGLRTVFNQQLQYIQHLGLEQSPLELFRKDLMDFISRTTGGERNKSS